MEGGGARTLADLMKIWKDDDLSREHREYFDIEKIQAIFFEVNKILAHLAS